MTSHLLLLVFFAVCVATVMAVLQKPGRPGASRPVHRWRLPRHGAAARLADVPAPPVTPGQRTVLGWLPALLLFATIFVLSAQPALPSPPSLNDKQAHALT
jgi:hypothetical protein